MPTPWYSIHFPRWNVLITYRTYIAAVKGWIGSKGVLKILEAISFTAYFEVIAQCTKLSHENSIIC